MKCSALTLARAIAKMTVLKFRKEPSVGPQPARPDHKTPMSVTIGEVEDLCDLSLAVGTVRVDKKTKVNMSIAAGHFIHDDHRSRRAFPLIHRER